MFTIVFDPPEDYSFNSSSEFIENVKERLLPFHREWFNLSKIQWSLGERAEFVETMTRKGMGFSFNLPESEKLLNFSKSAFKLI